MDPDVFLLAFNYVDASDRMTNVMAYQSSATNSATPEQDATDLCAAWDSLNAAALQACFPVSTYYTSVRARRVNNTGGPSYYGPKGTGSQGTAIADNKLDAGICALLTAGYNDNQVGGPDKFRVGRLFVGAVPWNFLADNVWTSTAVATYGALATLLSAPISGGSNTYTPTVWSRKYGHPAGAVSWLWQPTIACVRKRSFPDR